MVEVYAYLWGKSGDVTRFLNGDKVEGEIRKQSLDEHIKSSLNALEDKIKETKIWRYYAGLDNYADELMKLAIVLHDIGKIFYQRNIKTNRKKNEEYLSFLGHEFISTYLADSFLSIWLENNINERYGKYKDIRWIVYGSILYHHHAMGLRKRERSEKIKVCKKDEFNKIVERTCSIIKDYLNGSSNEVQLFSEEIKALRQRLRQKKFEGDTKRDTPLFLDRNQLLDIYRYVDELNTEIWRKFAGDDKFRSKMLLSTNILMLADYMGSEGRGEEKTEFGKILDESIELYSNKILEKIK